MKFACGPHWAHHLKEKITAINDLSAYPTLAHAKKDGWAEAGTYGDHLYEIEVAGESALVESQRMPVDTVLMSSQELARCVFQSNPVTHANWKKWRINCRANRLVSSSFPFNYRIAEQSHVHETGALPVFFRLK